MIYSYSIKDKKTPQPFGTRCKKPHCVSFCPTKYKLALKNNKKHFCILPELIILSVRGNTLLHAAFWAERENTADCKWLVLGITRVCTLM